MKVVDLSGMSSVKITLLKKKKKKKAKAKAKKKKTHVPTYDDETKVLDECGELVNSNTSRVERK